MEEWRVLAYRVQNTLVSFVTGTDANEFFWLVNAAIMQLDTLAYAMRRILMGATIHEVELIPAPPPDGCCPTDLIERARFKFEALRWDHTMAGHIISLYGARHGIIQGDPLWQTWEGHHATAIDKGLGALQGLHNAAASCKAAKDAMDMTMLFPRHSPASVAWSWAAESLKRRAISEVTTAQEMLLQMRSDVIQEFTVACMFLNR